MSRVAILILGMHRSGTSALTWLLGQLGAALPRDAIAASDDNARGYWESQGLVKADDQLLRVARSSWFDPRPLDLSRLSADGLRSRRERIREAIEAAWGEAPLIAIKDPRQCRFVPVIEQVLRGMGCEPRAVLMLRRPAEIARSLESRDGTTSAYAHLLWLRHMIDAERNTRAMTRVVVDYDGLLDDWRATAARLAPLTGRDGSELDVTRQRAIDEFLDPGLRHHHASAAVLDAPLGEIVSAVEEGLRALIVRDDAAARDRVDEVYARLDDMPWLEADIIHDVLRHSRMDVAEPEPEAKAETSAMAQPNDAGAPARAEPSAEGDAALIRDSGLFDAEYYCSRYPDVVGSGLDPIDHYLRIGAAKGYDPSPLFDTGYYARQMARRMNAEGGIR